MLQKLINQIIYAIGLPAVPSGGKTRGAEATRKIVDDVFEMIMCDPGLEHLVIKNKK